MWECSKGKCGALQSQDGARPEKCEVCGCVHLHWVPSPQELRQHVERIRDSLSPRERAKRQVTPRLPAEVIRVTEKTQRKAFRYGAIHQNRGAI